MHHAYVIWSCFSIVVKHLSPHARQSISCETLVRIGSFEM